MDDNLAKLRRDYSLAILDESHVAADPFTQFRRWFDEALQAQLTTEPNAMCLATADPHGGPSARMVLLKDLDERGFTFYTNYDSHKGHDLAHNPQAALCFFWPELERQVRIEGPVERLSAHESAQYFAIRPREAQVGAWASPQSRPLQGRAELERLLAAEQARFADENLPVPLPPHWGGYRVVPTMVEFWQGRPSRLHDRIVYRRPSDSTDHWQLERLAP